MQAAGATADRHPLDRHTGDPHTANSQAKAVTASNRPASALVIDDHPLFCEALTMTLRDALHIDSIGTAPDLATALTMIEDGQQFDIILLDLNLPDVNGMDGLVRLKAAQPATPVIVVSSLSDNRIVANALRAGAFGFVPKHSKREVIVDAIERIQAGETYVPEGFVAVDSQAENHGECRTDEVIERLTLLTRQQTRILKLLCEGKLNKQIAYELEIAEATVKAHITAILRKLKVVSRTQAVVLAQNARFATILQNQDE